MKDETFLEIPVSIAGRTYPVLTASKEVIMLQEWAVNMVVQLNEYDVRKGTDGFYENLMAEIIFWLKIFGENAKAIAIQYIA